MIEEWKEIKGNREIYEISNLGNIRTKERVGTRGYKVKSRVLSKHENSSGYYRCNININGKSKDEFIHRLVATAFIPNPNNYPVVNHKDGNKHNNRVDNLEWCTRSQNELHSYRVLLKKATPLKGELHGGRIFCWEDIRNIRKEYVKGSKEKGQCALARKYGTSQPLIYAIVNNKVWVE